MSRTIVLSDEHYLNHITRSGHPESPERLKAVYRMLAEEDMAKALLHVPPRPATKEEIALNHCVDYIESIESTAGESFVSLDPDTNTSAGTWDASLLAAGAVLTGIDEILQGRADNGFALVRPPGHHAEAAKAMGFCIFNNVAVGARYLMKAYDMQRIIIVDWDIHHGNGTQHSFYDIPEVLYFSTHQFPYYPGTGSIGETGEGRGKGYTVNVPLPGGQGDADYATVFTELLCRIAREYRPQFILVSAGYDTYHLDPLGTMDVTPQGFFRLTKIVKQLAEELCQGRTLFALEGGYHVQGITESVRQTLLALCVEHDPEQAGTEDRCMAAGTVLRTIEQVRQVQAATWNVLR